MKTTKYTLSMAYCAAYQDLVTKITEAVEVARDCHQMSGTIMEAVAYKQAAADLLHDIAVLTGKEVESC